MQPRINAEMLKMVDELILEGKHSSDPLEDLVWNEAKIAIGMKQSIKDGIAAMDTIIRTARLVRTSLRRVAKP
jgi:hypothetical protein